MDLAYVACRRRPRRAGVDSPTRRRAAASAAWPTCSATAHVVALPVIVRRPVRIQTEDIYIEGDTNRPGFELDADIQSGDSGGPVMVDGEVVGVLWARSSKFDRRAYAIDPVAAGEHDPRPAPNRRDRRQRSTSPAAPDRADGVEPSSSGFQKPGSGVACPRRRRRGDRARRRRRRRSRRTSPPGPAARSARSSSVRRRGSSDVSTSTRSPSPRKRVGRDRACARRRRPRSGRRASARTVRRARSPIARRPRRWRPRGPMTPAPLQPNRWTLGA